MIPGSVQQIDDLVFSKCDMDMVAWVEEGSVAERYCDDNVITYRLWDGSEPKEEDPEAPADEGGDA